MTAPPPEVRAEIAELLMAYPTNVGKVYRLDREGLTPPEIAARLNIETSGFVSNARSVAHALLDGHVPNGPTAARQVASAVRRFEASSDLSAEARHYLRGQVALLEAVSHAVAGTPRAAAAASRRRATDLVSPQLHGEPTLREQAEAELRARVSTLVGRIQREAGIDADDYHRIVLAEHPFDGLDRLVSTSSAGATFTSLRGLGRLDLALEAQVPIWGHDLPISEVTIDAATTRLDYYAAGQ